MVADFALWLRVGFGGSAKHQQELGGQEERDVQDYSQTSFLLDPRLTDTMSPSPTLQKCHSLFLCPATHLIGCSPSCLMCCCLLHLVWTLVFVELITWVCKKLARILLKSDKGIRSNNAKKKDKTLKTERLRSRFRTLFQIERYGHLNRQRDRRSYNGYGWQQQAKPSGSEDMTPKISRGSCTHMVLIRPCICIYMIKNLWALHKRAVCRGLGTHYQHNLARCDVSHGWGREAEIALSSKFQKREIQISSEGGKAN